jgi:hypothetical protein
MSRRPARFTQADIRRAIAAAAKAGAEMSVDILPDGTIRLTPAGVHPHGKTPEQLGPRRRIDL